MLSNPKEATVFEPVGSRLPAYLPPIYRTFFTNVLNGEHKPPAQSQITEAVDRHFSFTPLTLTTPTETAELRKDMRTHYERTFLAEQHISWKILAGDIYLPYPYQLVAGESGKSFGIPPLTPKEKENLLTDADFYLHAYLTFERCTNKLTAYGTRPLIPNENNPDAYPIINVDEFYEILNSIRKFRHENGSNQLYGLDIGGGTGLAAFDAENLDPNLQMTNVVANAELGVYPLRGKHVIMLAEYMPEDFFEKFDFIISNMAFMYFRFPDIALQNALLSLRVGGILRIIYSPEKSPLLQENRDEEWKQRTGKQFDVMNKLEAEGAIRHLHDDEYTSIRDMFYRNGRKKPYQHGLVFLQKLKSFK
jgi:SAM-dependent methyltransferase